MGTLAACWPELNIVWAQSRARIQKARNRNVRISSSKEQMSQIAVIGGGAWGTGIAIVLGRKGTHRVRLWAHESDVCDSIMQHRFNERFLPGRRIPDSVTASNDLATALEGAHLVVSVMPSQHCRGLFARMRP